MAIVWGIRGPRRCGTRSSATNLLDTGAPYYDTYETKDGGYVSIGPIEPHSSPSWSSGGSPATTWRPQRPRHVARQEEVYEELFLSKTRDEWCELLEGTDVCFAPVLPMSEAAQHPHPGEHGTIIEVDGVQQPAPAPRFSRTPGAIRGSGVDVGEHTDAALADWGFAAEEIAALHQAAPPPRPERPVPAFRQNVRRTRETPGNGSRRVSRSAVGVGDDRDVAELATRRGAFP